MLLSVFLGLGIYFQSNSYQQAFFRAKWRGRRMIKDSGVFGGSTYGDAQETVECEYSQ